MLYLWIGFITFVLVMLALDLGVINRHAHVVSARQAMLWTLFCAMLACGFGVFTYFLYENNWFGIASQWGGDASGRKAALEFFTGWIVEQSLSLDNIFVIAMIFAYFHVPPEFQHRVLFWGILGALIMRGVMIAAGTALIHRFEWVIYIFGGLLLVTAVKLLLTGDNKLEPDRNPLVRLARKLYPVSNQFEGQKFFTRLADGKRAITPLFLVLLVVESTDVLFAVDSIPAVFAVTRDPFIVFTSNVFAILNLRSLYFALAAVIEKFRYLKPSLVFVLAYVGIKMILSHHAPIPVTVSLAVIATILMVGVVASIWSARRES